MQILAASSMSRKWRAVSTPWALLTNGDGDGFMLCLVPQGRWGPWRLSRCRGRWASAPPWGDRGPFLTCSMPDPDPACRFCARAHYSPGAKLHLGARTGRGTRGVPGPAPPPGSLRGTQPPVSRQEPRTPRSTLPMGPSHVSKHPQSVPQPHPLSKGPTRPPCCLHPTL